MEIKKIEIVFLCMYPYEFESIGSVEIVELSPDFS